MADYVSRDDVRRFIAEAFSENRFATNYDYAILFDKIGDIPATDVQSVKRGRWICEFYNDVFDVYQADCSVCKRESTDKYDKVSESYEYCPHCGARMDSDTEGKVTERNVDVSRPDGNCLDCEFQYRENSDYWCSICPGNPEDI